MAGRYPKGCEGDLRFACAAHRRERRVGSVSPSGRLVGQARRPNELRLAKGENLLANMTLSDEAVAEYANLYKGEFGEEISLEQARIEASLFMELCRLLVQLLPNEPDYKGPPLLTL